LYAGATNILSLLKKNFNFQSTLYTEFLLQIKFFILKLKYSLTDSLQIIFYQTEREQRKWQILNQQKKEFLLQKEMKKEMLQ
ncbi:MAG: hypothetical protein LUE64_07125, partial [Candidatus Gastranaerophilales bacterium]|nr:hypothetical protein [Candidatus Gastranaerophilales bacterium]